MKLLWKLQKNKKPHTIAETLIKPCLLKTVKLVLGEPSEIKMRNISLSNNTIQRRISDMSIDMMEQILSEIRHLLSFPFNLMSPPMLVHVPNYSFS